ncbi:MAG: dual-specificity protein phosphatase 7 [Monoraphidium minutum]|nr:MAG: dual-specificity protein phosphatase 7 [Monoraphidium minutum]
MKGKREREEACSICGHYHDYEGGEPCKVCGHVLTVSTAGRPETVMPTTVVPGFLYLGSYDTASRQELLKAMQITDILNTVPSCQPLFKNTFNYHTVSVAPPEFDECFEFLDKVNGENKRVLVYCMTGVSRAPAVVIGYLMKLRSWRLAEAYKWVKDKRPAVNISQADSKRLVDLEMRLHNACSVPFGFAAVSLPGSLVPQQQACHGHEHHHQQEQQQQAQTVPASSSPGGIFGSSQVHFNAGDGAPRFSFGSASPAAPPGAGGFVFGGAAGSPHQQQQQQAQPPQQQHHQHEHSEMET